MVSKRARLRLFWRRMGISKLALVVLFVVILAILLYLQKDADTDYTGANLFVVAIVNLNIIALAVLIFLIGRNITKLVFDRKNKVLGSRLRSRLVMAFVGLTLVPTSLVLIMASSMMGDAVDRWFNSKTESLYTSAIGVANIHYRAMRDKTSNVLAWVSDELTQNPLVYKDVRTLHEYLERERKRNKLFSISIYSDNGELVDTVYNAVARVPDLAEPDVNSEYITQALAGKKQDKLEVSGSNKFIRIYFPLNIDGKSYVLTATHRLDPELTNKLGILEDSSKEHKKLKLFYQPLRSGYILTLTMVTALILFAAIWIGFYIAKEITGPLRKLAEGTRAIASGNYDYRLREIGEDEFSSLAKAFNIMTSELKLSRAEVERRRLYLESILARLAVAVIALDIDGNVSSVNKAALQLFGYDEEIDTRNIQLSELLPPSDLQQVESILRCIDDDAQKDAAESEVNLLTNGRLRKVVVTAGAISDEQGVRIGSVLIFDDMTDLVQAQQSAAWREVARRIAHEIKNPLTPIQLSAQRLQKLLKGSPLEDNARESTAMILEHVSSIKRLTDEFAKFARMPPVEMVLLNLNNLISEILATLVDQHPDAIFQFIADKTIPEIPLDREQIRRVLINLIDNGLAACRDDEATMKRGGPNIVLKTSLDSKRGIVRLEVADNGPGIPRSERARIFEPYMTTKVGGTGLGLPIVASILAEHQAEIKVFDNVPYGTRFVVELRTYTKVDKTKRLV